MSLTKSYANGILTCTIEGDGTNDTTWFSAAVAACNAHTGPSVISPANMLLLTSAFNLTGSTSIVGIGPEAGLSFDTTGDSQLISWNESYTATQGNSFTFSDAVAGDAVINIASGTNPVKGDIIVIWSNDQITGLTPHYDVTDFSNGQHPEHVHLVDEAFGTKIILSDPIPFDMSSAAQAQGTIIPSSTLAKNIVLDNLILNWHGAGDPDNYAAFRFKAIDGLTITDRVITTRKAPCGFFIQYCTNITFDAKINGSAKTDGIYGLVVGPVNGLVGKPVVKGTRHGFTTTQGQGHSLSITGLTVDAVGDTLQKTSHGLVNGDFFTVIGTVSDLSTNTPYWVVNASANDFQVAASPGGAFIPLTSTTATGSLQRNERWGTPLNVVLGGIWYSAPKWSSSTQTVTRQVIDTHAEGYRITFDGARIVSHAAQDGVAGIDRVTQYLAQSRSIGTIFKNCTFEGASQGANQAVRLLARDCQVINCVFNGEFWYGVETIPVNGSVNVNYNGTARPDNCVVMGNYFNNCTGYTVRLAYGANHVVANNVFRNCSGSQGGSPFYSKSLIAVLRNDGHIISNNVLRKDINDTCIDTYQLTPSDIHLCGNNCTGYGTGSMGVGRIIAITSFDTGTNEINVTTSHGFASNDVVRFATTGTLVGGLLENTDYYVISVDTNTFKVSDTPGPGTEVALSGSATGTHDVRNAQTAAFETAYAGLNFTD